MTVDRVARAGERSAAFGPLKGTFPEGLDPIPVTANVAGEIRHDTVRNHTATHLLHAALREVLGEHVVQRGSLVAPDRLRFDFAHTAPMTAEERHRVEEIVNRRIWEDHPVTISERAYRDAVGAGAMALFGEKYGDRVRVVDIPGVSTELCGGTHANHTGEIGLFRIVGESGVAAGVRRVEALTGPGAYRHLASRERVLEEVAEVLRTKPDNLAQRAERLLSEKAELEALLAELRSGGGGGTEEEVVVERIDLDDGGVATYRAVRLRVRDAQDARTWGDAFLHSEQTAVAVVVADLPEERQALFTFVTDDLISRGIRADAVVRDVAAVVGGKGGGRPHLAQAGVGDPSRLDEALSLGAEAVRKKLLGSAVE
jgi:alanyl-tRNA synthetase